MDAARAEKPFIGGGSRPFAAFWRQKDEAAAGSQKQAFGFPPQPRGPGRRPGRASRPPYKRLFSPGGTFLRASARKIKANKILLSLTIDCS